MEYITIAIKSTKDTALDKLNKNITSIVKINPLKLLNSKKKFRQFHPYNSLQKVIDYNIDPEPTFNQNNLCFRLVSTNIDKVPDNYKVRLIGKGLLFPHGYIVDNNGKVYTPPGQGPHTYDVKGSDTIYEISIKDIKKLIKRIKTNNKG